MFGERERERWRESERYIRLIWARETLFNRRVVGLVTLCKIQLSYFSFCAFPI